MPVKNTAVEYSLINLLTGYGRQFSILDARRIRQYNQKRFFLLKTHKSVYRDWDQIGAEGGSLQHSPRHPSWIYGVALRQGKDKGGKTEELTPPITGSATDRAICLLASEAD